jgi:MFS family permease
VVFLLVLPQTSDRFNDRRWHVVGCLSLGFISSIVCVAVRNNDKVRYAFLCFYIAGLYTSLPLILNWVSDLISMPAEKRAVVIAMVNCVGSLSSIYGSYLWPSSDAPNYTTGFAAVSSFIGVGVVLAAILPIIFKYLPKFPTKAEREMEIESTTESV